MKKSEELATWRDASDTIVRAIDYQLERGCVDDGLERTKDLIQHHIADLAADEEVAVMLTRNECQALRRCLADSKDQLLVDEGDYAAAAYLRDLSDKLCAQLDAIP